MSQSVIVVREKMVRSGRTRGAVDYQWVGPFDGVGEALNWAREHFGTDNDWRCQFLDRPWTSVGILEGERAE